MKSNPVFFLRGLCVLCGWFFAFASLAATPKEAFEQTAAALKFFAAGDLLYDRLPDRFEPKEDLEHHNKLVGELLSRNDKVEDVLPLLKHDNPKVRTLALAALYRKHDVKLLPQFVPLCEDTAPTFPHPALVTAIAELGQPTSPLEPQTVADFPRAIVRLYMSAAAVEGDYKKFESYWLARKDRSFCASWFKIDLDRATQRTRPVPPDRAAKLQPIRDRINALTGQDRAWTILYLATNDEAIFDQPACIAAAKSLGPEPLMQTLEGKCPSQDPDLQNDEVIDRIGLWTLKHAGELLRQGDAKQLLTLERLRTPWYAIAAAHLDPQESRSPVMQAFARFPNEGYTDAWARADLATALWRLRGPAETDFILDWFYGETLKHEGVPHSRATFLSALDPAAPQTRAFVQRLVKDPRFQTLDWSSLKSVARIVNRWTATIPEQELTSLHHPYGEQQVVEEPDQAAKTYPEQTKKLNQTLADWRQRIRKSIGDR